MALLRPKCQILQNNKEDQYNKKCQAIILDISEKFILIIKENVEPSLQRWGLPKGKFKIGETSLDCAKREVCEEVGIEFEKYHTLHSNYHNLHRFVILKDWNEIKLTRGAEISTIQWVNINWLKNDIKKDISMSKINNKHNYKYNMITRKLFEKGILQ
jgi:8-oxo-dGTP pyrophosphatase MutT (NUDIX family)